MSSHRRFKRSYFRATGVTLSTSNARILHDYLLNPSAYDAAYAKASEHIVLIHKRSIWERLWNWIGNLFGKGK